MRRMICLGLMGAAVLGLSLVLPSESQAGHRRSNFGVSVGFDGGHFGYYRDYGYRPYYARHYYHYPRYYGGHSHVIIHPEYSHWTPDIGWHTHGHIHIVPHYGHHYHDYYYHRPYRYRHYHYDPYWD